MKLLKLSLIALSCAGLLGCENPGGINNNTQVRDYSSTFSPLPENALYPISNPYNETKERLGESLFWDPILSGDQNTSCASCHHPDFGWADGRQFSIGSDGIGLGPSRYGFEVTPIHSPTIMNVAFTGLNNNDIANSFVSGGYFWDLRARTLEEQALGPIKNPIEMLGSNISEHEIMSTIVNRLQAIPEYVELFEQAFPVNNAINSENLVKALATFQRKIITSNTRFDQFMAGNQAIFNLQEIAGLNKFIDSGCARCHSGPMLSDNRIHPGEAVIEGVVVRTPSLRNISATAPYMHDGSSARLVDAIAIYENRDDIEVNINDDDFADIEAFLRTLDSTNVYQNIPEMVPSGLTVGGDIN